MDQAAGPGRPRTAGGAVGATVAAARRGGALIARGGRAFGRAVRRGLQAGGAGESGLARMLELHLAGSAADAMVVTALASTIFFAVPTEQARSRVITSLLVTMVPFVLLAPVIGPLLDRVRRGRRIALGVTMGARAWLAWVMAGAIADATPAFSLYPAAFGFLVCQKSYLVIRAAALPRVLPHGEGLLRANARMSIVGVVAMAIGGPLGVAITRGVGPEWTLRLTFVLFLVGIALTLMLSTRVDSDPPEQADQRSGVPPEDQQSEDEFDDGFDDRQDGGAAVPRRPPVVGSDLGGFTHIPVRRSIGTAAVIGLRGNAALRAFTGFLTLFLAFRLRTDPLPGMSATTAVGLVIALAAVGGALGTALGALARRSRPEAVVAALLVVLALIGLWASLDYGLPAILGVALVAGLAQSLSKLCLDAVIQADVPDAVRTSAFARSETVLQLAWVIGGALGLMLPLSGAWGLGMATALTAAAAGLTVAGVVRLGPRVGSDAPAAAQHTRR